MPSNRKGRSPTNRRPSKGGDGSGKRAARLREAVLAAYMKELSRLARVAAGRAARKPGKCPHCGLRPDASSDPLAHLFEVALELGVEESELRRPALELYVQGVPRLMWMAAGETTEVILDAEGRPLEVEQRWRDRIAAFNQLTRGLTELKAKLEEEVQAHYGLTLEELWTQCQAESGL